MSVRSVVADAYRGALPTLLVSAVGGLLAGTVLAGMDEELATVDGLLVLVPAFLAIRGSVYGSLGARLSSALHQGLIEPRFEPTPPLLRAIAAALVNGVSASLFAATVTVAALRLLGRSVAPLSTLGLIAFLGGLFAGAALVATVVTVVFLGFRRGMNPDDLVGPAVTTAGDVFGMFALLVATRIAIAVT